jgi:hypothetical protein
LRKVTLEWDHGIPKTVDVQLKKIARAEAKNNVRHFSSKKDGWPLDFSFIANDIMFQRYKIDSWSVMLGALYETGMKFQLVYKNNQFLLVKGNKNDVQNSKRKRRVQATKRNESKAVRSR